MPCRAFRAAMILCMLLLLAACAARHGPPPAPAAASELAALGAGYDGASSILSGFDLADEPGAWRIGDRVLLGVRLRKPGTEETRLLLVELLGRLNSTHPVILSATRKDGSRYRVGSPIAFTRLVLFDEQGRELDRAVGNFPRALLGYGLYDGAMPIVEHAGAGDQGDSMKALSGEQEDRVMRGWLALIAFSGSMNKRGLLKPMLADALARPGLLTMLLNPSVSLGVSGGAQRVESWRAGGNAADASPMLDAVTMGLVCSIADNESARAQVLMVRPVAPLSLCGGVVGLRGHNAKNPGITFEITLLAARRGGGGQDFIETASEPDAR